MIRFAAPLVVAVIALALLILWVRRQMRAQQVSVEADLLVVREGQHFAALPLQSLTCIKYSYHAVVGVVAEWQFTAGNAPAVRVAGDADGLPAVLTMLERRLPGVSLADLHAAIEAGDAEDVITLWGRDGARARANGRAAYGA
jgi:NADPH-dependent ferric siderophore reductase